MYVIGKGHDHEGPGTSLVQRINWTTGQEQEMQSAFAHGLSGAGGVAEFRSDCRMMSAGCSERGLGCGCAGKCSKGCGLGFFDGGLDPSTFGPLEWGAVAVGGYVLFSTVFTTRRAARAVGERVRHGRRRLGKRIAGA